MPPLLLGSEDDAFLFVVGIAMLLKQEVESWPLVFLSSMNWGLRIDLYI